MLAANIPTKFYQICPWCEIVDIQWFDLSEQYVRFSFFISARKLLKLMIFKYYLKKIKSHTLRTTIIKKPLILNLKRTKPSSVNPYHKQTPPTYKKKHTSLSSNPATASSQTSATWLPPRRTIPVATLSEPLTQSSRVLLSTLIMLLFLLVANGIIPLQHYEHL